MLGINFLHALSRRLQTPALWVVPVVFNGVRVVTCDGDLVMQITERRWPSGNVEHLHWVWKSPEFLK
jgi:hypothetical protein